MAICNLLSLNQTPRRAERRGQAPGKRALGLLLAFGLLGGCGQAASPAAGDTGCDLNRQVCSATTGWGPLKLELAPQPLPVLQPIDIAVRFERPNQTSVSAQLDGVEMDMGPNLVKLQRVDANTLRGQIVIPICLTGQMKWRLSLRLKDGGQEEKAEFSFEAPLAAATGPAAARR